MKQFILTIIVLTTVSFSHILSCVKAANTSLINNVMIIDGTGTPGYKGAVRLQDGLIHEIGTLKANVGEATVDGKGLTLAPGFIDTHSHHDWGIFDNPSSTAAVSQGITTIIVGQDGGSNSPLKQFFTCLENTPVAVNIGSFSGHGSIRTSVMGEDFHRAATKTEIAAMSKLLKADMDAGAFGLSTGLEYEEGVRSTTDEIVTLASVVADAGGRYISHMRSEDTYFWKALEEIIEIGKRAALPVQVSHIKLAKVSSWGKAEKLITRMNEARKEGVDITADIYPYTYWSSTIRVFFPELDYDNPKRARIAVTEVSTPEGIYMSVWAPEPSLEGKTLAEIAKIRDKEPAQVLMDMISELEDWEQANKNKHLTESNSVIAVSMTEDDIVKLMQWKHTNISSDGADGGGHPRGYGAFPRVLGPYVRTNEVLDLATAVHKMTGQSANHMGITSRGTLTSGKAADMVLFDPETIIDNATIKNPTAKASGIAKVWVNGKLVYVEGSTTGKRPGKIIRRAIK